MGFCGLLFRCRSTPCLDRGVPLLGLQPLGHAGPGGYCRSPGLRRDRYLADQFIQPAQGFCPVFLETAEFLGLDDHDAILAYPVVTQFEKAIPDFL